MTNVKLPVNNKNKQYNAYLNSFFNENEVINNNEL